MTLRDQRQNEFAEEWIRQGMFGILYLAPRFGKIYTTINIFEKTGFSKILIAYPDATTRESWESDFKSRGFDYSNIVFTTFMSLKKHIGEEFDMIVIDEIHLLSMNQMLAVKELRRTNRKILGLTGTLSSWTEKDLRKQLYLPVIAKYSIAQAIDEEVVSDYEITVVKVPLDNTHIKLFGKKRVTEKKRFDSFTWVINKLEEEGKNSMFMRIKRVSIIQGSLSKELKTIKLLQDHPDERILVFCGLTEIADDLGIPSYHSKSKEKDILQKFASGEGNHLAVVKLGNTGVTYKPLNRIIVNYFDSNSQNLAQKINRCMSFEYDNPDKKAHIYIISSTEADELKWLEKALEFFDKSKIKYL